ncbi:hypothetical protein DBR42_25710 [Pelomonas sp. HMWF004]|nr:hypothetical protein DBR42_25710 [Pelomonas sp. HMWF004]
MDLIDWHWVGIGSLLLALVALVLGLARGEIQPRLGRRPPAEERLARYPASARAVIIKAQRRRALWRLAPQAVIGLAFLLAMTYAKQPGLAWLCNRYGADAMLRGWLGLAFYELPGLLAVMAGVHVAYAIRVLRGGYLPPLDSVTLHDTVAVSGWRARLAGVLGITVLPVTAAVVMGLGHSTYQHFSAPSQAAAPALCPGFGKPA